MTSAFDSQAEGATTSSSPITFWLDARQLMRQLAVGFGAAVIVRASDAYVAISGETMEDCLQAAGDREILDSAMDGSR